MSVPLRRQVGLVSVGRAKFLATGQCRGPLTVQHDDDDETAVVERGTPAQPVHYGEFSTARSDKTGHVHDVRHWPHFSPSEAATQICRLLKNDATQEFKLLIVALVHRVEDEDLLPGFSSAVVAAPCVKVAKKALQISKPLLGSTLLKEFNLVPSVIRLAYNRLWWLQHKLRPAIRHGGGDPSRLPQPKNAKGEIDYDSMRESFRVPPGAARKTQPVPRPTRRHQAFISLPSSLVYVTQPSEDREESGLGVDEDGDDDSEQWFDAASEWSEVFVMDTDGEDTSLGGSWSAGVAPGIPTPLNLLSYSGGVLSKQ